MSDLGGPADLLLIHWPPEAREFDAVLERLVAELQKGMTRHIGVSNFTPNMMRRAYERTDGKIINNQVEFHPLLDQRLLLAEAKKLGVVLSAYSPLGRGAAMKPEAIQAIAKRIGRLPFRSRVALDHSAGCSCHADDNEARERRIKPGCSRF